MTNLAGELVKIMVGQGVTLNTLGGSYTDFYASNGVRYLS